MADREMDQALGTLRRVLEETKGQDRRAFLTRLGQAAAGSALLTAFGGMLGKAARAADPVTTMGWGGSWQDAVESAFFAPWTKKTSIPVRYVAPYEFAKLRAMHQAGQQQIDTLLLDGIDALQAVKFGMDAPLDFNVIDKSALTPTQRKYENAIGAITLSQLFVYNKNKWSGENAPKNWADFWDVERFPGPRAMRRRVYPVLEAALLADGVPADPAKMYPLDVERAFRKLDEIKPHVVTWWSNNSASQQLVQDGEVDLCMMTNGRASDSILNGGAPYEMVWNQALYNGYYEAWFLMKGSPNPEGAMKLLDFVGRAEPQAAFARASFYGPINMKAYDLLDPEFAKHLPSYPDNEKVALPMNYEWWLDNVDELTLRFETWVQS